MPAGNFPRPFVIVVSCCSSAKRLAVGRTPDFSCAITVVIATKTVNTDSADRYNAPHWHGAMNTPYVPANAL